MKSIMINPRDAFDLLTFEQKKDILQEVRPEIERIINRRGTVWGPTRIIVIVNTPNSCHQLVEAYGDVKEWNPEWGEWSTFGEICAAKLQVSLRTGKSSREVRDEYPFLLQSGDCLWAGSVAAPGIAVAASGLTEDADEEVAQLILDAMVDAARQEISRRRESDDSSLMIAS